MPSLAITGNIGCGKSTVMELLSRALPDSKTFSADRENRALLNNDSEVKELLKKDFGESCIDSKGIPDRDYLTRIITSIPSAKARLEEILHPRLEKLWKPLAEWGAKERHRYFLAEIPLLYEKELEGYFSRTILVACSDSIKVRRLERDRSLTPKEISAWMKQQIPQEEKIPKADHLVWNDSIPQTLEREVLQLSRLLLTP